MTKLKRLFLSGVLTILPLALSLYIIKSIVNFMDNLTRDFIVKYIGMELPGSGIIITTLIILFIGLLMNFVIGRIMIELFEKLLMKTPILSAMYKTIKDISHTIISSDSSSFSKVVLLEFPIEGTESIGFVTNSDVILTKGKKQAVFIPTTPNPTNGFLVYVDEGRMTELDMTVDEAIKIVVGMGTIDIQ